MRTAPTVPSATRRLVLRPGVHVLRRSASELQVGLDPRRAVVLPDEPEVRALLDRLTSPASVPAEPCRTDALEALAASGLLIDVDVLLPLAPAPAEADSGSGADATGAALSRATVAALAAEVGDRVGELLARRSLHSVEVVSCGAPEAAEVAAEAVSFLAAAGLVTRVLPHGRPPGKDASWGRPPSSTGLLVAVGEPAREHVDGWMRTSTPHLHLRLVEGAAVVGPFVLPGETACLRCLDAHYTDVDRAWPLLVTQYAGSVSRRREDTVPEPVDRLLAALGAAWAAKEVVAHADGRVPATTSTTLRLDPQLTALETQRWPRHPSCGCTWG